MNSFRTHFWNPYSKFKTTFQNLSWILFYIPIKGILKNKRSTKVTTKVKVKFIISQFQQMFIYLVQIPILHFIIYKKKF